MKNEIENSEAKQALAEAKALIARLSAEQIKNNPGQKFRVLVDDNYHYMDSSARSTLGEFPTYAEALAAAKEIVDDFLLSCKLAQSPEELLFAYKAYGEDPWIVPDPDGFSAWEYAAKRAVEIAKERSK